jgi:hypothetical protein
MSLIPLPKEITSTIKGGVLHSVAKKNATADSPLHHYYLFDKSGQVPPSSFHSTKSNRIHYIIAWGPFPIYFEEISCVAAVEVSIINITGVGTFDLPLLENKASALIKSNGPSSSPVKIWTRRMITNAERRSGRRLRTTKHRVRRK